MLLKVLDYYKIPLFLSVVTAIVILAINVPRETLAIIQVVLGALVGTFLLDLDYIIFANFLEPANEFSVNLKGYLKHRDFANAVTYVHTHRYDLKDRILNSALFQIVLAGAAIFVSVSNTNLWIKVLVISTLVNSIYRLIEEHLENRGDEWFWALKSKPRKYTLYAYIAVLIAVLIYSVNVL